MHPEMAVQADKDKDKAGKDDAATKGDEDKAAKAGMNEKCREATEKNADKKDCCAGKSADHAAMACCSEMMEHCGRMAHHDHDSMNQ